jgi:hypothetical protein
MNKLVVVTLLLATSVAAAGPKSKAPPPPVPKYWIGEFAYGDDDAPESGAVQDGYITVKSADAPEKGIIVQPLDPKYQARPAIGLGDESKIYSAKSFTPAFEERPDEAPRVLVVDAAVNPKPAVIRNKKLEKTLRKRLAKDYPAISEEAKTWAFGIADLDADGIGDVALFFGCHMWDGGCSGDQSMMYERDGKGWKEIKLRGDDE